MKTCLIAMSAAIASVALLASCSEESGESYCGKWCEMALTVELEQLEDLGCELDDDEEVLVSECEETCRSIAHEMESPDEVKVCIECIYGEVGGQPSWEEYQDALNVSCEDLCFGQSMMDFYFEFWGDWNYQEYDYECD